jgi:lipopolysaccharide export system protein LptA
MQERNEMKKTPLYLIAITMAQYAFGQTGSGQSAPIPRAKAVDVVEETGRVLKNAGIAGRIEAERITLDQSAVRTRLDQAVGQTHSTPDGHSGVDERAMVESADRKLDPSLGQVAPQGKALITQSSAAPAMRAPDFGDAPATAVRAKAVDDEGAGPIPLVRSKRDSETAVTVKPGKTETPGGETHIDIVCQGSMFFDSKQSMAVFTDDVVVNHPEFHLTSDELQVYMLKEDGKPKDVAVVKPRASGEVPKPKQDSSIKQAIATGRKVVIQKMSENGDMQIGICRHATYIGESGDIILREMPQVQRAKNLIIAKDKSTYMILKQSGELKVFGPNEVKIIQEADKKEKVPAATVATGQPVPVVKTLPANKPAADKTSIKKKDKGSKL